MNMIILSISLIGILTMAPTLMIINVFCAVTDYRQQKLENRGKTAVGIKPYQDSVGLSNIASFGLSGLLDLTGIQISEGHQFINPAYPFFIFYAVIMPTFEILVRAAARCREPDIQFKKFLWMKY